MGSVVQRAKIASGSSCAGRALVEVEVAQGRVEGAVEDRLDRLVLQDVLGAVQVVDRRQLALGQGAEQRVERLGGHAEL